MYMTLCLFFAFFIFTPIFTFLSDVCVTKRTTLNDWFKTWVYIWTGSDILCFAIVAIILDILIINFGG